MIEDYHFGSMTIGDKSYRNDVKIIKGKVVSSWWRKEGHLLDDGDIDDIVDAKPAILVVGKGDPGNMEVSRSLRSVLEKAGIQLIEEPTARAMHTFNRLSEKGQDVAGAFHLTC